MHFSVFKKQQNDWIKILFNEKEILKSIKTEA
jgi:hypothetical protein